jgi:4-amino-4-deoxy-L-arabinose transferase-like glycosyltransferase
MAFGMPLALFGLHRYLKSGTRADLAWFALGWLSALLSNAYVLVFFPILVALWLLWFFRATEWRRYVSIGVVAILATAAVLPWLRRYYVRQTAYGFVRSYNEIKANSADITALAGISHRALLWKDWLPSTYYETSLFPGFAIVALVLIGVVAHVRKRRRHRQKRHCHLLSRWRGS